MQLNPKGQAQLLAVSALGVILLTGSLYLLDQGVALLNQVETNTQQSEMRYILDAALKHANYLYQSESGCDPVVLDEKLNCLRPDGTVAIRTNIIQPGEDPLPCDNSGTSYRRQMAFQMGAKSYTVSFGVIDQLEWKDYSGNAVFSGNRGISQDAYLEAWTTVGDQRMVQKAILLNTCTYPCYVETPTLGYCFRQRDQAIAYHQIKVDDLIFTKTCQGSRVFGDLNDPPDTEPVIDMTDLQLLKNYLKTGVAGSSTSTSILAACADLNQDSIVNEEDLALLEKFLRGFLDKLPIK